MLRTLAPLAVVVPSTLLPRWIADLRWEHVVRHAVYTLGFGVGVGANLRWDVVWPAAFSDEGSTAANAWAPALVTYSLLGVLTLGWFCVAHVLENHRLLRVHTHHGDIAVLPLSFVAVGLVNAATPDAAFAWSRSIVFFVPVVVGHATLNFCGHLGFATSAVTTHHLPGFRHVAHGALVVASAHLCLIELRASATLIQFFPIVAALVLMRMPPVDAIAERPPARRWAAVCVLAAAGGLAMNGVTAACAAAWADAFAPLHSVRAGAAMVYACVAACVALPPVTTARGGARGDWAAPGAALATLLTLAYVLHDAHDVDAGAAFANAAVLGAGYALTFATVGAWL